MFRASSRKQKQQKRQTTRINVPLQRVKADIQIASTKEVIESRVFLTDLSPTGVGLFTNITLDKGEEVSLVIEQPKHLFVKGKVIWCAPYTLNTKVISNETFTYRVGIKFSFETPAEAETLQKYCQEIIELSKS